MAEYDAVLVPGGGLTADADLPTWSENRLEAALRADGEFIVCLSAGTTHHARPVDANGFPVFESEAAARHLIAKGFPAERILVEACSYDTIGNAYFARMIHAEARRFGKILVVTSEFHMPRTEAIFRWIFGAPPLAFPYDLSFRSVDNVGFDKASLEAREQRERESLEALHATTARRQTLPDIHAWLFSEHRAYMAGVRRGGDAVQGAAANTY